MSARRGGRGRGSRLSELETLGIKPGDGVPPPILQPPGVYPPVARQPLDLSNTPTDQCMLMVKQEHLTAARQLPFYITRHARHGNDILRYSNKYRSSQTHSLDSLLINVPLWKSVLPKQLHFDKKKRVRKKKTRATTGGVHGKKVLESLSGLAEKEEASGESEEEEGNVTEDDFYDEEMEEETGDYQLTYFDPGDGDDDDFDAIDGPSY